MMQASLLACIIFVTFQRRIFGNLLPDVQILGEGRGISRLTGLFLARVDPARSAILNSGFANCSNPRESNQSGGARTLRRKHLCTETCNGGHRPR